MPSSTKQGRGGRKSKGKTFGDILTPVLNLLRRIKVKISCLSKLRKSEFSSTNSSASFIGCNTDILTLILIRLPSKSLLVFICVSKQWLSIITDPQFVHNHFIQNPKISIRGLFWGDDLNLAERLTYDYISLDGNTKSKAPFGTLIFAEDKFLKKIVQSCNGLLLCKNWPFDLCDFPCYIFNPFTNKYKILLQSQLLRSNHMTIHSVSLAFDPFKSPYYKVIAIWAELGSVRYEYRIEIYDSEASSWRLSGFYSFTENYESIPWMSGIFWNGSLYWCHGGGPIVYFDIDRELVGVLPNQECDDRKRFRIAEYGGHFYLFETDLADRSFKIFEMDAANSGWNVKGQVDVGLNPYSRSRSSSGSAFLPDFDRILCIVERGEKESTKVVLLTMEGMVVSYDLKDLSFGKIFDLSASPKSRYGVKFHKYIESLACV